MEPSRTKPILFPFVTVGLMVTLVLADLSLAENLPPFETGSRTLLRHWLYIAPMQVWAGGYWALLTAPLAHALYPGELALWAKFSHLLLDMMGLWFLGRRVEAVLGHSAYFGLVFFSAIVSTAMGILAGEPLLTQGMTGVCCAMIGLMLATRRRIPAFAEVFQRPEHVRFVGFWLILVLTASQLNLDVGGVGTKLIPVSNASNLGGWLFGVFVGMAFYSLRPRLWAQAGLALLAAGSALAAGWTPWIPDWHVWRAIRQSHEGNYVEAMQIIEPLLAEHREAGILNLAAWTLATARDERVLDGARAEALALEACDLTQWQSAPIIDTLAAAYAEQENWSKAIETQEKALAIAESRGDTEGSAIYLGNLNRMKRREKIRE